MVIPLATLAILAFVVIRSLMLVVAHEAAAASDVSEVEPVSPARARTAEDMRTLLAPAAGDVTAAEDAPARALDVTDADAYRT